MSKTKKNADTPEQEKQQIPGEEQPQQDASSVQDQEPEKEQDAAEQELEKIKADLDMQKDLLLRTAAEFDNYKKRTARETERIGLETRAAVLKSLLPALDNFLRSRDQVQGTLEDYKKGIDMCVKQFEDLLTTLGLEEIEAQDAPFDPQIHYAVSQVTDENVGENIVVQVLQKGYRLGDIVLRPAMVSVANC